jgi:type II secretory pathway pseudopilin PulG
MRGLRRHDRAAALMIALVALVILGALGTALGTTVLRGIVAGREAAARDNLLNVAESGIDLAMSRLARDVSWAGSDAARVPGGECVVTVKHLGDGVVGITSHAVAEPRPGRRTGVHVVARKSAAGLFSLSSWKRMK